ncbi:MAG TPA: DUF4221 family protein [Chitinophagales bacterium]|nr:DUF4221 family protein [Chitinophagales bacterium]
MTIYLTVLLAILTTFLESCSPSTFNVHNVKPIKTTRSDNLLVFALDSFRTENLNWINYKGCSSISALSINDSAYLVLQNRTNNFLDVYNLESHSIVYSIEVPTQYKLCEDMSSTFIKDNMVYHLFNNEGALLTTTVNNKKLVPHTNLNSNSTMLDNKLISVVRSGHTQLYVDKDSLLFLGVVNPYKGNYYNYPITATLNLKTGKINTTGIAFPRFLYKNDYGLMSPIKQLYTDNHIVYACDALPEIWRYDLTTSTLARYITRSNYQTDSILPLPFRSSPHNKDQSYNIFMHSARYDKFVYDPYKNVYYRFFVLEMPQKNEQGLYNTHKDRRLSVMVLDENFNLLGETLLPPVCNFIFFAVASKQGLFINYGVLSKSTENDSNIPNILKIKFSYADK